MKNIYYLFILGLLLTACSESKAPKKSNLVVVSIAPQKYLIDKISAKELEVVVMVKPGASPATYEPSPKQMKQISETSLYIKMGKLGFESIWLAKFKEINPKLKIGNSSEGITYTDNNPHVWVSAKKMNILAQNTFRFLQDQFPEKSKKWQQNYESLISDISGIDSLYNEKLNDYQGKSFMIFHPALFYLAKDYGLNEIAIEEHGKEPTPAHLSQMVRTAKQEKIGIIFIQKEFDRENAEIIAKETKAEIKTIDPLNYDWLKEENLILRILVHSFEK